MLTAHERLRYQTRYPLSMLSCPPTQKPACVLARKTNLAKLLQSPIWTDTSAEIRIRPARFVPARRSNAHTSHQVPIEIP